MNYKDIIIKELSIILQKETIEKNTFKIRAYNKVISQIKALNVVSSIDDLKDVSGIGSSIKLKIQEIFDTGKLKLASEIDSTDNFKLYNDLLKIHGVGSVKAKELINVHGITSIDNLKAHKELLTSAQIIGLKYYRDIDLKIPRNEMKLHELFLKNTLRSVDVDIDFTIVGSFRRNESESGDVDVLLTGSVNNLAKVIEILYKKNYIKESLSLGSKKFMGICKLDDSKHYRRIDVLFTNRLEYPFALLYFTGSKSLNIKMRNLAIQQGLKLNEHSLTRSNSNNPILLKNEEEIFNYLGMQYIEPHLR